MARRGDDPRGEHPQRKFVQLIVDPSDRELYDWLEGLPWGWGQGAIQDAVRYAVRNGLLPEPDEVGPGHARPRYPGMPALNEARPLVRSSAPVSRPPPVTEPSRTPAPSSAAPGRSEPGPAVRPSTQSEAPVARAEPSAESAGTGESAAPGTPAVSGERREGSAGQADLQADPQPTSVVESKEPPPAGEKPMSKGGRDFLLNLAGNFDGGSGDE